MDYLYKKCPNPMNKRMTDEDRHIERVTFSCFIKQLGMIDNVLELIDALKSNKKPNISLYFKQMMEMIYKTRRTLKQQKQNSNTLKIQNGFLSDKIDENFDIYLESYMKKCIFLLNIEPSLKFNVEENQDLFSENLKKVTNLICSMSTLEDLYSMMMKANEAKGYISTSIALLSDLIISNKFKETTISSFDIFKKSDFFIQFFETLPETGEFKSPVIEAILERSIQYMFELQNEPAAVLTIATFIFNILQAIARKDKDFVLNKLSQIIQKVTKMENNPIYTRVLSLCTLYIFVMIKENPKLQSLDVVGHITSHIFPENNI
ncbi:hypothetical protein TVAG_364240 [Trichomonas vaginalis G3]|uniref:Uncharacterized protein n=1 Tax=Trichomonas vaginalis (strain ATCC PRA-98 / G3) TaxID=412133 RepID=A2E9D6_TRIV3|nr:guanyl-nucleotide exchange factor protein [Trichomonas vaginalis G3]EAY10700.1 hypothetical protein TVAG_364240 [Trichomonas vaginalis G3]KAI5538593.1 guanyl-nucleotide exchange factor protein [Trichomonas vaginalis G3]|eukprot:XP_001322923.1 hypothetical protein [Trichomonas vaginalis G3]